MAADAAVPFTHVHTPSNVPSIIIFITLVDHIFSFLNAIDTRFRPLRAMKMSSLDGSCSISIRLRKEARVIPDLVGRIIGSIEEMFESGRCNVAIRFIGGISSNNFHEYLFNHFLVSRKHVTWNAHKAHAHCARIGAIVWEAVRWYAWSINLIHSLLNRF